MMKTMLAMMTVLGVLALGAAAFAQCGGGAVKSMSGPAAAAICPKCGEIAGSERCCKEAELCPGCGLHKGSPGCLAKCASSPEIAP